MADEPNKSSNDGNSADTEGEGESEIGDNHWILKDCLSNYTTSLFGRMGTENMIQTGTRRYLNLIFLQSLEYFSFFE